MLLRAHRPVHNRQGAPPREGWSGDLHALPDRDAQRVHALFGLDNEIIAVERMRHRVDVTALSLAKLVGQAARQRLPELVSFLATPVRMSRRLALVA